MTRQRHYVFALGLVALAAFFAPAMAQTVRNAPAANPQVMQQMQQLASERTALQAENAKLKTDLDALRKERDTLRAGAEAQARRARTEDTQSQSAVRDRDRLEAELAQQKQRMQELVAKFRETATSLRDVELEAQTSKRSLFTRETELKSCVDRNQKLYSLNEDVLSHLESQGFWSSVAQREPFTRIKRAQLESLVDSYRDSAQDQRVPEPSATP